MPAKAKVRTKKIKAKTHKGAAKRFQKTASGKVKFRNANRNHILTKKAKKLKRQLRVNSGRLCKSDARLVIRMLQGC